MCLCLGVGFVGFILKQRKYLVHISVWCDMNEVTIPHALFIENNIVYYVISFREGWYEFKKSQCGDPEHRIKLCEINSIKTNNIDGYITMRFIFKEMNKSIGKIINKSDFNLSKTYDVWKNLSSHSQLICGRNEISHKYQKYILNYSWYG